MAIQISISNAIGSRYRGSVVPPIDPDAQAFITAASITDPTQQSAINQLVIDLKSKSIWTKMKALYPMVGGTAAQHKWNLKDPRDLDAAFRLVFNGGWTHSANGALPNGTNGYADTFLTPSTALSSENSTHLSSYIRTASQGVLLGTDNSYRLWIAPNFNGSLKFFELNTINATSRTPISTSTGFWLGNRPGSIDAKLFNQGVLNDNYSSQAWGLDNFKVFLAARNVSNAGSNYSSAQIAFSSIGDGLTDTEATNFYTAVQAFQTTLGRSIGTQTVSDADAQAFVTNAGIVDQVEANAVNNLVIGLKADGLWTKMSAIYPMVGGTSSTMKYNLKNPLDTDAAFRIVWTGGVTHSSNGVQFNGVNGYGDTKFTPSLSLSANSAHLSYYSRTASTSSSNNYVFAANNPTGFNALILRDSLKLFRFTNTSTAFEDAQNTTALATSGLFLGSQDSSNIKLFRNGSNIGQNSATASGGLVNIPMFIGATNDLGSANAFTTTQCAFASIGDSLSDTEAANLNSRVTTFQTALNRNV